MAEHRLFQLSLFDQQYLGEITSPDFPRERLIACRDRVMAADRDRTREDLWQPSRSCSPGSSPGSAQASWPAPVRSASRSAR